MKEHDVNGSASKLYLWVKGSNFTPQTSFPCFKEYSEFSSMPFPLTVIENKRQYTEYSRDLANCKLNKTNEYIVF